MSGQPAARPPTMMQTAAAKWAIMPGATTADPEVVYACSSKLAS